MKNAIKFLSILLTASIIMVSCKGDKGDVGPQGPSGPSATKYSFSLTFDNSSTFKQYSGLIGKVGENDAVLVYAFYDTYGTTPYYVQLPFVATPIYFFAEIGKNGDIIIDAIKSDGSAGSPFPSNQEVEFKAIVIKGNAGAKVSANRSYEEVCAYYNLK